jgi:RimJ/RimL family protein N-acetyltransferase
VISGSPQTRRAELKDGRVALVAPVEASDRRRFVHGMEHASADSLYSRFMSPVTNLSKAQLRYLLNVDHADHEALLAVDEESGEAVGVGRFVRLADDPGAAEAAVLVIDSWQGCGLGTALCLLLAERARELDIERFVAYLLVSNKAMLGVLERLGPIRTVSRDEAVIEVEVTLPGTGIGEQMSEVLRAAAARDVEPPTDEIATLQS